MATHYGDTADFITVMIYLKLPALMEPFLIDAGNAVEVEIWKLYSREYQDKHRKRKVIEGNEFSLILGLCSNTVGDRVCAADSCNLIIGSNNVMENLRLIRKSMFTGANTRHAIHSFL